MDNILSIIKSKNSDEVTIKELTALQLEIEKTKVIVHKLQNFTGNLREQITCRRSVYKDIEMKTADLAYEVEKAYRECKTINEMVAYVIKRRHGNRYCWMRSRILGVGKNPRV